MNINHKLSTPIALPALVTGIILLVPLIAMQFTNEVIWTLSDFMIAGTLLFGTGLTYKLTTKKTGQMMYRMAVGFALFSMLFLTWVNLAVGIIGSEDHFANLIYFAVIGVGIIGTIIARFRSSGMSLTMFLMAFVQTLVTVFVLLTGMYHLPNSSIFEVLSINGVFITLFIISALLFRYNAKNQVPH